MRLFLLIALLLSAPVFAETGDEQAPASDVTAETATAGESPAAEEAGEKAEASAEAAPAEEGPVEEAPTKSAEAPSPSPSEAKPENETAADASPSPDPSPAAQTAEASPDPSPEAPPETEPATAAAPSPSPSPTESAPKTAESAAAPATPPAAPEVPRLPGGKKRTVTVLTAGDTSGYNLGTALQYAVGQLFKATENYEVQLSSYSLTGFTPEETKKAHDTLKSEVFSFAYLDRERISLFIFDAKARGQFIVAVNNLLDPGQTQLTTPGLESKLRKTFQEALALFQGRKFQYLPGAGAAATDAPAVAETEEDIARRKAAEAGHLFRELATLAEKPLYLGVGVGMARYSDSSRSTSLVNLGFVGGYKVTPQIVVEGGLQIYTYALAHLDARYQLPLAGRYVFLSPSFGIASNLFQVSSNTGFENAALRTGALLFGPGFGFEIPLLGASIRGDLRLYFGAGTVLVGNYAVTYGVSL